MDKSSLYQRRSYRKDKVCEEVRAALPRALRAALQWDDFLSAACLTVMHVVMGRDLSTATVTISTLYGEVSASDAATHLKKLAPLVQKHLASFVYLKRVPALIFTALEEKTWHLEQTLQHIRLSEIHTQTKENG